MNKALATSPLALASDQTDDGPVWVEMLRTGVHKSRFTGGSSASGHTSANFDREDLESAVRGFDALSSEGYLLDGKAPVGYEHDELASALRIANGEEPETGEVKAAAAWYSAMRVVENEDGGWSLQGLHHWTDAGRKRVRAGAFRSYSIDLAPPGRMQRRDGTPINEWVPFGGTVTNSPFVRGMEPLAAAESAPDEPQEIPVNIDHLRGPLALSEDATEADAIAALHDLKKLADERSSWQSAAEKALGERDNAVEQLASLGERQKALAIKQAVHEERIALTEGEDYWSASRVPSGDAEPAERGTEQAESADDTFERLFGEYVRNGKTEPEAYALASADTHDARVRAYANA